MDENVLAISVLLYFVCSATILIFVEKTIRKKNALKLLQKHLKSKVVENNQAPSLEKALSTLEQHRKRNARDIISRFLNQAGFSTDWKKLIQLWLLFLLISKTILLFFGVSNLVSWFVLIVGSTAPFFILKRLAKRRKEAFASQFSSAVDLLVRGVRSGLSVNACIKNVAQQGPVGVRKEFLAIYNDIEIGIPIERAMERFSQRVDLPEARFFSIVISVQSTTGGNLTTALSNLSDILRTRKQLKGKIQSLSAEAKTGATIIGGVPIMVIALLNFISPQYMNSLISSNHGQLILLACVLWMGLGTFIMSKMIDLET